MKKAADSMAVLPPVPLEIRVATETLALTPLVLGELPAFAKAMQPITADLSVEPDWLLLLGRHGEAMIDTMVIASRQPRDWVAALGIDEAIGLAQALFEVNADFFMQRIVPRIVAAGAAVNRLGPQLAGPTPASA